MKKIIFLLVCCIFVVGGCAKQPTRDEVLQQKELVKQYQTRVYEDEPALVLRAAERVLVASDRDYHALPEQSENVYSSKRSYFFTMLLNTAMGEDFWRITADRTPEGKTLVVAKSWSGAQSVGLIPLPTTSGGDVNNTYLSTSLYRLFFERLDYVLGKRETWTTCSEAESWTSKDLFYAQGGVMALCNFANSDVPEKLK